MAMAGDSLFIGRKTPEHTRMHPHRQYVWSMLTFNKQFS
jgi:hypothetical protein